MCCNIKSQPVLYVVLLSGGDLDFDIDSLAMEHSVLNGLLFPLPAVDLDLEKVWLHDSRQLVLFDFHLQMLLLSLRLILVEWWCLCNWTGTSKG